MIFVLVTMFGFIMGSFLGQLIDRLPKNQKIWSLKERSRCPHCKKKLKAQDLIPVISFIWLRGRCRFCRKKISMHYPLIEVTAALVTLYWYWNLGSWVEILLQCFFWYGLLLIAFIDWRKQIVFEFTIWLCGLLAMTLAVLHQNPAPHLMAALISGFVFWAVGFLGKLYYKQDALGQGDVYIAMVAGLYLGLRLAFFSFYISLLAGGGVALYLMLFKKLKSKSKIAFGPALIFGMALAVLFGDTILKWYLG